MRRACVTIALLVTSGCPEADVVECGPGGDLRNVHGELYCVYGPGEMPGDAMCPAELPYAIRYADYLVCSAEMVDPDDLPDELCRDGTCAAEDAGWAPDATTRMDAALPVDSGPLAEDGATGEVGGGFAASRLSLSGGSVRDLFVAHVSGTPSLDIVTMDDLGNAATLTGDGGGRVRPGEALRDRSGPLPRGPR